MKCRGDRRWERAAARAGRACLKKAARLARLAARLHSCSGCASASFTVESLRCTSDAPRWAMRCSSACRVTCWTARPRQMANNSWKVIYNSFYILITFTFSHHLTTTLDNNLLESRVSFIMNSPTEIFTCF